MASITDINVERPSNLLVRIANGAFEWLIRLGEAGARTKELEHFNSMSDAQLAELGLRREQIVQHVFRDRISY